MTKLPELDGEVLDRKREVSRLKRTGVRLGFIPGDIVLSASITVFCTGMAAIKSRGNTTGVVKTIGPTFCPAETARAGMATL